MLLSPLDSVILIVQLAMEMDGLMSVLYVIISRNLPGSVETPVTKLVLQAMEITVLTLVSASSVRPAVDIV